MPLETCGLQSFDVYSYGYLLSSIVFACLCDPMDCSQAPQSMEFSRQEYWSGLPCPTPGGLPSLGIEPATPVLAGGFVTSEPPGKHAIISNWYQ